MSKIVLNKQAQYQIQQILNSLPISELEKVQRIVGILNSCIEVPKEEVEEVEN